MIFLSVTYYNLIVSLQQLQLHKILRHTDRSCELVDAAFRILTQQIVREKKLDSEYVCLTLKLWVLQDIFCF